MTFKIGDIYKLKNDSMPWEMIIEYQTVDLERILPGHKFFIHKIIPAGLYFTAGTLYTPTMEFYDLDHMHIKHLGPIKDYPEYLLWKF